jgi:hypothetical protein
LRITFRLFTTLRTLVRYRQGFADGTNAEASFHGNTTSVGKTWRNNGAGMSVANDLAGAEAEPPYWRRRSVNRPVIRRGGITIIFLLLNHSTENIICNMAFFLISYPLY